MLLLKIMQIWKELTTVEEKENFSRDKRQRFFVRAWPALGTQNCLEEFTGQAVVYTPLWRVKEEKR